MLPILGGFIGFIIIGVIAGSFCKWLAGKKGYSEKNWFWLGFFFEIISIITLAGAPDLNLYDKIREQK